MEEQTVDQTAAKNSSSINSVKNEKNYSPVNNGQIINLSAVDD